MVKGEAKLEALIAAAGTIKAGDDNPATKEGESRIWRLVEALLMEEDDATIVAACDALRVAGKAHATARVAEFARIAAQLLFHTGHAGAPRTARLVAIPLISEDPLPMPDLERYRRVMDDMRSLLGRHRIMGTGQVAFLPEPMPLSLAADLTWARARRLVVSGTKATLLTGNFELARQECDKRELPEMAFLMVCAVVSTPGERIALREDAGSPKVLRWLDAVEIALAGVWGIDPHRITAGTPTLFYDAVADATIALAEDTGEDVARQVWNESRIQMRDLRAVVAHHREGACVMNVEAKANGRTVATAILNTPVEHRCSERWLRDDIGKAISAPFGEWVVIRNEDGGLLLDQATCQVCGRPLGFMSDGQGMCGHGGRPGGMSKITADVLTTPLH